MYGLFKVTLGEYSFMMAFKIFVLVQIVLKLALTYIDKDACVKKFRINQNLMSKEEDDIENDF